MPRNLMLPLLLAVPFSAQASESVFDDSLFSSSMYISSSQSYQIKKLKCEAAGIFTQGNLESKIMDLTFEAKSQGGGFDCGQSLDENALVLGFRGDIVQTTMDGVIVRYEDLTSTYAPYIAFQLTPDFSLGVSEEVSNAEVKNETGSLSGSTHRLLVSGTWHDGPWELTLVYSDRFRSTFASNFEIPRSLDFAFRYAFSPLLTAGVIFSRFDYPGIASDGESLVVGHDQTLVVSTRLSDAVSLELSYRKENDANGSEDASSVTTGAMGQFILTPEVKVGGFIRQFAGDSAFYDSNVSAYGLHVTLSR